MRKVMMLAAMLAMMLVAAAPAMAQDAVGVSEDGDVTATGGDVQYVDCSQVIAVAAQNVQYGDAAAAADDGSVAQADTAAELGITVNQVNACLGGISGGVAAGDDGVVNNGTTGDVAEEGGEEAAAGEEVVAAEAGSEEASASAAATLPDTGGASLFTLGAGALLVAGGLIARRIVR